MPAPPQEPARHTDSQEPAAAGSPRRRRVPLRLIAAGAGVALLVPVASQVAEWVSGFENPLEQRVIDRSTAPLLLALEDLQEFHAAKATFQVVIDREKDTRFVPSAISGERVSFLATGTADASVDFDVLAGSGVTLSPDGTSAEIVLPAPRIGEVRIDPDSSRVLDRDRGALDRVGAVFAENPSDDGELYALAERRLAVAAAESDLLDRAERNTRAMLTGLARSLGVDRVDVRFEPAPGDAG
ncbi:DUF4230 domain-containing protein [Blastococcus saxobsidens]|uniref:DUF4230 domain-containing protein n=1 Tax=Blastococcus saxobsidens (strain DD2) TaxID=1146883 RepID=H6RUH0_BLASD|nr:DUF4230 domain-containing protein [Blastococcus saxobsidens]CCG01935.1 conserved protein of unknown function [Blastococcus saxobsidens DD2]